MARMFRTASLVTSLVAILGASCKTDRPAAPAPASAAAARPAAATPAPASKPVAPPAVPGDLEARGVALMQQLADLFGADARDCDKLAADVQVFVARNRQTLSELVALENSDDEPASFGKRNQAVADAVARNMQTAMAACAGNPRVVGALKDLTGE